jgi:hypothetical protein
MGISIARLQSSLYTPYSQISQINANDVLYLWKRDASCGEDRHSWARYIECGSIGIEEGESLRVNPLLQPQPRYTLQAGHAAGRAYCRLDKD